MAASKKRVGNSTVRVEVPDLRVASEAPIAAVFVYGPSGSGKSSNASPLAFTLGARGVDGRPLVVDGWSVGDQIPLASRHLILTQETAERIHEAFPLALALPIERALGLLDPNRCGGEQARAERALRLIERNHVSNNEAMETIIHLVREAGPDMARRFVDRWASDDEVPF